MKKFLSMLLVLVLTLSMGTVAFAATDKDNQNPTFTVIYKLDDAIKSGTPEAYPAGITAPDQTFTYSFTAEKVEQNSAVTVQSMPTISNVTVSFTGDGVPTTDNSEKTGTGTIDLSKVVWPGVGVYYYKVTQSVTNEALGVTYSEADHTLKVTVYQDTAESRPYVAFVTLTSNLGIDTNNDGTTDNKTNGFINTYAANNLAVSKEVTGNMGDRDKEFSVDVTFTAANTMSSSITYTDGSATTTIAPNDAGWTDNTGDPAPNTKSITKTITLKHGETVTFQNLPVGVTYIVKERDYTGNNGGYDAATYGINEAAAAANVNGASSNMDKDGESVKIINNKGMNVDMGIGLDSLPYILLLAVVVVGLAVFFVKKRAAREN